MKSVILIALVYLFCAAAPSQAEAAVVYLKNGDRVSGKLVSSDERETVIQTDSMGEVVIRTASVSRLERDEGDEGSDQAPKADAAQAEEDIVWDNVFAGGFDRSRGNTSATELHGDLKIHRKTSGDELTIAGFAYYSEEKRKMNSRRYGGSARYAFSFGEVLKWYHFYKIGGDHDQFGNVEYRYTPSTGVGYWFSDTDEWKLNLEVGCGVTRTEFVDRTEATTEFEIIPRGFFQVALPWHFTLTEEVLVYTSMSDFGEYRLHSETVLDHPLNEALSLRLSLVEDFNSDAKGTAKENDLRILSSLAYRF